MCVCAIEFMLVPERLNVSVRVSASASLSEDLVCLCELRYKIFVCECTRLSECACLTTV